MKTSIACCLVVFMQHFSWAQNNSAYNIESTNIDLNDGLIVTLDSMACGHVVSIDCLPGNLDYSVVLKIELEPEEVYTFVKSNDLFIPEGYTVYIKDKGTGNVFDLNSKERHTFTTNRTITKYFMLERRKINHSENMIVKVN